MALYIVQHGLSLPKEVDPQKGLSPQGRLDVERMAQVAAGYHVPVAQICHSGKQRAVQTAQIYHDALQPVGGMRAVDGIQPLDDVAAYAATIDLNQEKMIVGHLPFLERFIALLTAGREDPPVFRLQNGGIVCLDYYKDTPNIIIKWAVMPNIP